ncbi:MAG: hypothetical protein K9M56_01605 [Victivallales bacterium]|nr:hypothetical protein [Victivallales bacterium]
MKKKFLKIFCYLTGLLVLFVILILTAVYFAFSNTPNKMKVPALDYSAWFSANRKIKKEMNILSGNDAFSKTRTVRINKEEVNSLLNMSVSANKLYSDSNSSKPYELEYIYFDGKVFTAFITLKTNFNTPFGRYLNLKIKFVPVIDNDTFEMEIKYFRIGNIPIPAGIANYLMARNMENVKENESVENIVKAVKVFTVKDDSVVIKYSPAVAASILEN